METNLYYKDDIVHIHICKSPKFEPAKRIKSNGVAYFKMQCQTCGYVCGNEVKKPFLFVEFNDDKWNFYKIRSKHFVREKNKQIRDESKKADKEKYLIYLSSEEWILKRDERLIIDNHKCIVCGIAHHLQVHHLNYDNIYNEKMSDLVTLCKMCHMEAHNLIKD